MKSIFKAPMKDAHLKHSKIAIACLAFGALLTLTPKTTLADRGQGSIRAAARPSPAPHAALPSRPPARAEPPHAPPPEVRHDDHAPPPPEARHDDHAAPPPRVEEQPRREWDDNDEDAKRWGGFGPGSPVHAMRGQRVHDLPHIHFTVVFNSQNYFCDDDGAYYEQQSDGEYLVVQPPVGAIVTALPSGVTPIAVGPTTYFYLDGVFYIAQGDSFAVVNPPPGIIVPTLPSAANTDMVIINGVAYYQFNGFNYQPSIQDGVTAYTVTPM